MEKNISIVVFLVCGALVTRGAYAVECYVGTTAPGSTWSPGTTQTCAYCVRTESLVTAGGVTAKSEIRECRQEEIAVTVGCTTEEISANGIDTEITTCKCTTDLCNGEASNTNDVSAIECYTGTLSDGTEWTPGGKITCSSGACSKVITETKNGDTKTVTETRGCGSVGGLDKCIPSVSNLNGVEITTTACTCTRALCNGKPVECYEEESLGDGKPSLSQTKVCHLGWCHYSEYESDKPVPDIGNLKEATMLGCADDAHEGAFISKGCSEISFEDEGNEIEAKICFCDTDKCNDSGSSMLKPISFVTLAVIGVLKGILNFF